jgi:hypothetical protein
MNPRIQGARVTRQMCLELDFTDGTHGIVDLGPMIAGHGGVFEPFRDPAFFAQVAVDYDAGTVVWPNGVDLDPDVLYEAAHAAPVANRS